MTSIPCNTLSHRGDLIKAEHMPPTWLCLALAYEEMNAPACPYWALEAWDDGEGDEPSLSPYEAMIAVLAANGRMI